MIVLVVGSLAQSIRIRLANHPDNSTQTLASLNLEMPGASPHRLHPPSGLV